MAGTAQKSPQTHKIAAPICWSSNGGRLTPGTCAYTEYHDAFARMLIDIASTHIWTFVNSSAAIWAGREKLVRNGADGMNWSQNNTPTTKKVPCISQMCTAWF